MTLAALSGPLSGALPLGHLVWWTVSSSAAAPSSAQVGAAWGRPGQPRLSAELPGALEQTMRALQGGPRARPRRGLLARPRLRGSARGVARRVGGALRVGAAHRAGVGDRRHARGPACFRRARGGKALSLRGAELESLLLQPRARASLLVRQLDALDDLRRQAALHARHLEVEHPGLAPRLDEWARSIDDALCACIVA